MTVDEKAGCKTASFHETKNGVIKPVCEQFKRWKEDGMPVKTLRMGNAGENKKSVKALSGKDWQMCPGIERTSKGSPQHNCLAEASVAAVCG